MRSLIPVYLDQTLLCPEFMLGDECVYRMEWGGGLSSETPDFLAPKSQLANTTCLDQGIMLPGYAINLDPGDARDRKIGMTCDQLYYDGQCPLCLAEMDRLRELADAGLELVDIHTLPNTVGLPDRETLLGTLHLKREGVGFLVGMDANVAAWGHTPYGWLWRPLRWPLVRNVADLVYRHWARWRYRRLY